MSAVLDLRRRAARAAVTVLFLGNGVLVGTWAANIPRVRALHGLTDSELGTLLLAFGLGAVAAMLLAGVLVSRFGAGRVAATAALVSTPGFPLLGTQFGWPALLGLCVVLGALNGTVDVAMNAYASDLERQRGDTMMSSFHAGWSVGGLAGAAFSGLLASAGWGLASTFMVASCVVAASAAAGATLPPFRAQVGRRMRLRLPSRRLAGLCALAAICFQAEGAVMDWSGVYLDTVVGTGAAWATTGYTAFALTMTAGRLTGDAVVSRLGPVRVVWLGGLLAAVGLGLGLAVPNRWVVDAGLILAGAGLANSVPVVFSAGGRLAGTAGVAAVSGTGFSGLLVAPPLLGHVADWVGLRLALVLVLVAMAAMTQLAGNVAPPERR